MRRSSDARLRAPTRTECRCGCRGRAISARPGVRGRQPIGLSKPVASGGHPAEAGRAGAIWASCSAVAPLLAPRSSRQSRDAHDLQLVAYHLLRVALRTPQLLDGAHDGLQVYIETLD